MENEKVVVETEKEVKGHLVPSFTLPTPMWATWAFRIVFLLTTAVSIWVVATGLIQPAAKSEIILGLKIFDVVIWGVGRGLGIKKEDFST